MSQDPWGWYGRMIESDRNMQQQGAENLMAGVTSAVGSVAGAYIDKNEERMKFDGMYNFLSKSNILSPEVDETVSSMAKKGNYAGANAYIAPYLAELDFGRKSMLAGRSGFFDDGGNWQMAIVPEAVQPRNKSGYRVGGNQ